jgi:hypothetical protein
MVLPSIGAAGVVVIFVGLGAAAGMVLQRLQPEHHRGDPSKDIVKLVLGLMGTMTALVLSLLIASAHTFYDTQRSEIQQLSVDVLLLDDSLRRYGPPADAVRAELHMRLEAMLAGMSPATEAAAMRQLTARRIGVSDLITAVGALAPATDTQRLAASKAQALVADIASIRLLIHEQTTTALPTTLAAILLCWLVLLFVGFGLFAPLNGTVVAALLLGALSVGAAMFLMLSMTRPYSGLMHVSDLPLREAVAQLGQ